MAILRTLAVATLLALAACSGADSSTARQDDNPRPPGIVSGPTVSSGGGMLLHTNPYRYGY